MQLFLRALIAACAIGLIAGYALGVDVARLGPGAGAVTFLDRSGLPLGTILASDTSHAVQVPLARVAPVFVRAIVDAEDARFASHGAIDVPSMLRAAREIVVYGDFRSGGSTIPMQLARLLHPLPSNARGKIEQIAIAERLMARSNKAAILAAYVNRVPMGGNLYGVEAASRTYFGESSHDLDLAQASLLAAIPNDPSTLAPDVNWKALRLRQRYVLGRMVAVGDVDRANADRAFGETLHVRRHDAGISDAAHALFYLYASGGSAGGTVRTTIDRDLQRFVQAQAEQVVAALQAAHVTDAAALVVDNRTGDVLAYVGSPDYFSDEALGRNDGVQALRQPGSSLKPFTYELALERHAIRSTTILPDVPSTFSIPGGKLYQPADYSGRFSGPVRVRYALANSLNVPAVRALSCVGVDAFLDRLHDLGFNSLSHPASYYGLGLTLGGGEVSLWDLTHAYLTMEREGNAIPLRLLQPAHVATGRTIGEATTWTLITNILADPHARAHSFGMHSVLQMPFDAAVKTGTSSDFRDTWTIGYTRDYTVGAWVGNFDGSAMRNVSGVTGAGPLWNRIMLHLHERHEPVRFGAPRGYVQTPICATTGHAPTLGCEAVVNEWVLPRDLATVREPIAPVLGDEYDPWLALYPADAAHSLRIVFPRNGATFALNPTMNGAQALQQQLAFRATGARGPLQWTVNGVPLSLDSEGIPFWHLALGQWRVEVRNNRSDDEITIRVVDALPPGRRGYTYSK